MLAVGLALILDALLAATERVWGAWRVGAEA
jgi:hypothetical protein